MDNISYDSEYELLVRGINKGNKTAFETLYRANYSNLCDLVNRYIDSPDISEELVQDLFLSIWNMKDTWNPPTCGLRSYLYRGAKNRALDYIKHQEVKKRYLKEKNIEIENEYLLTISNPDPNLYRSDEDSDEELANKIEEAIGRLPERGKTIFNLSRDDGLTYREIADVLDISVKTVETQMGRSLKKLREYLSDYLPMLTLLNGYFQIFG